MAMIAVEPYKFCKYVTYGVPHQSSDKFTTCHFFLVDVFGPNWRVVTDFEDLIGVMFDNYTFSRVYDVLVATPVDED